MPPSVQIEDSVVIARPLAEVFAFFRDFRNLPRFLGDVVDVQQVNETTFRWTVQGPFRVKLRWLSVVTEVRDNDHIFYEAGSEPFKNRWEIYFSEASVPGDTLVREVMIEPGGKIIEAALALIGKHPSAEVHSNLHRLKQLVETGAGSDKSVSVSSRFS